jgi:PPE-repeat protein
MIPAFAFYPPELNSALMFAGAGSGPLFGAASAWDGLASDLSGAAASFDSVVTGLTNGPWSGPASLAMVAAATPYVGWLSAAAGQAEAAAAQARVAATAFESALAATIPTPVIAANRAQLMTLIATNILGQNTPAIFMTEFEYMEMWAADVAAMLGYHGGAAAVAAALPSFSLPSFSLPGLTGLLGSTPLSGVVSQVTGLAGSGGSALTSALSPVISPVVSAVSPALSQVTSSASNLSISQIGQYAQFATLPANFLISPLEQAAQAGTAAHPALDSAAAAAGAPKFVDNGVPVKPLGGAGGLGSLGGASAGLGNARLVGAMSVPPTWTGSTPTRMVSSAMSGLGSEVLGAAGPAAGAPMGGMPMPMPMGAGAGAGMPGGMMGRGGASPNHVVQERPSVVPRTGVG